MTTGENEDRFAAYLDQYVSYLEGVADRPHIGHLDTEVHGQLSAMFRIIDANWASEIELPAFEEDPVAQALGLVHAPSSTPILVVGSRVKALRKAMKLSRSDLVGAVSAHGWPISSPEVARLERADADMLPASQALALARALRTGVAALGPSPDDPVGEFLSWLYSREFEQVVASWAAEHGRDFSPAAEEARTKMLSPARRSRGPGGRTQWLQTLQAILEAME